MATHFGTHIKNRPGFEKLFRGLADKAFDDAISLIQHMTKRGGQMNFNTKPTIAKNTQTRFEVNELHSLALALEIEKDLATEAHHIHEHISHANNRAHYDPEIAHYIEEEFIEEQAKIVRQLSGYTNDLKKLVKDSEDTSLSVFLFDEYLQKQ